ncbi:glycosyltransferase family 2 protein [Maricaulis maris]|uniref:glycosyltransferase family 2 protein n=1 Tax=Maricaulis maris TaxID=74318 RepID=UPI003A90C42C
MQLTSPDRQSTTGPIIGVVPAHNESRTIAHVVEGLLWHCDEVIVLDDGSTDDTHEIAKAAGATVRRSDRSAGYSSAVGNGFDLAANRGARCVVTVDGDCAHILDDTAKLIDAHLAGNASLTLGSRFLDLDHSVASTKILANRVASVLVAKLFPGRPAVSDVATGFRVYDGTLAQELIGEASRVPRFGLCYASIVHALRRGLSIQSEKTTVRYDGSQLLSTRRSEFDDLLSTLVMLTDGAARCKFEALRVAVRNLNPIKFELAREVIYALPIREADGYLFQAQSELYRRIIRCDPEGTHLFRETGEDLAT